MVNSDISEDVPIRLPSLNLKNHLKAVKSFEVEVEPFLADIISSEQIDSIFPISRGGWALLRKAMKSNPLAFKRVEVLDYIFPNIEYVKGKKVLLFNDSMSSGVGFKSVIRRIELFEPSRIITAAYGVLSRSSWKPNFFRYTLTEKNLRTFYYNLIAYYWLDKFFDPDELELDFEIHPFDISKKILLDSIKNLGLVYSVSTPLTERKSYSLIPRELHFKDSTQLVTGTEYSKIRFFFLPHNRIVLVPIVSLEVKKADSNQYLRFLKEKSFIQVIESWQGSEDEKMLMFLDWLQFKFNFQMLEWLFSSLKQRLRKFDASLRIIDFSWARLEARYPNFRSLLSKQLRGFTA